MIALSLVAIAALVAVVELGRHHGTNETAVLVGVLVAVSLAARWLVRDLRVHPANFPPADGLDHPH